jgi:hypothetical protein
MLCKVIRLSERPRRGFSRCIVMDYGSPKDLLLAYTLNVLQNGDSAVPPIAPPTAPAPQTPEIASGSDPADFFDNPLSEKDEAKDLVSDWELSQSIAADLGCLQVRMYVYKI